MQDKVPFNENFKPHGLCDFKEHDNIRACGYAVNGGAYGYWIQYNLYDKSIKNKEYYAK